MVRGGETATEEVSFPTRFTSAVQGKKIGGATRSRCKAGLVHRIDLEGRIQEVAVVGGGDTATEEALYLTKYASAVHLLVRGPRLRASGAMQDRVRAHEKVTLHHNTEARPRNLGWGNPAPSRQAHPG